MADTEPVKKTRKKREVHPNTLANMQKKGEPGHNPKGRPKGSSYRTFTRDLFAKALDEEDKKGNSILEQFTTQFISRAIRDPDSWQAKSFADMALPSDIEELDEVLNRAKQRDLDFLSYRIYKQCFDIQQTVMLSKSARIFMMAGRRAGKTATIQRKIADILATKTDAKVLYVGKTITTGIEQIFNGVVDVLTEIGADIAEKSRASGHIGLTSNSELFIRGNTTTEEREKLRGYRWDLVVIDECQSQTALAYLINDIVEPALLDRKGQLILAGTGPRVRGTYWEELWTNEKDHKALRVNWNLSNNPFIPDHDTVFQKILEEKGLTESSPLFVREYLGRIAYDDDAMVYRATDANIYKAPEDLVAWINSQPRDDIRFTAGLDYGFSDSDAFVIIMYSESSREKWLLYEYKCNRTGIMELAAAIKRGLEFIHDDPIFQSIPERNRFAYVYCDTNEQKITYELYNQFGILTQNAQKYDKPFAIEMLREEFRLGNFKLQRLLVPNPAGGEMIDPHSFYDETLKTVYARNDRDELTHEIDDNTFHPDLMDAVLYALRNYWAYTSNKLGETSQS